MRNRTRFAFAAALISAVAMIGIGCGDDDESDKFRLGVEAPLTGDLSVLGEGMLDGANLAASELNDQDGIMGKQVEIVSIDDAGDPDTGVEAAKSAIDDGLDGVVGPYNSGVGIKT